MPNNNAGDDMATQTYTRLSIRGVCDLISLIESEIDTCTVKRTSQGRWVVEVTPKAPINEAVINARLGRLQ